MLDGRITEWEKLAKPLAGKQIVTFHRSWSYFATWLGIRVADQVEPKPGVPPSPGHTSDLINLVRKSGIKAIVVEFQPKPRADPQNDFERQASKMAGTLWIDEASQSVIRLESYFTDDDNRNVQGSSLRMERTFVNDEVWLPSRLEMNLRRSWAFGKFSNWVDTVLYIGHKKFNVDSDFTITLPDAGR